MYSTHNVLVPLSWRLVLCGAPAADLGISTLREGKLENLSLSQ